MESATESTDNKENLQAGFNQLIDRLRLNQESLTIALALLTDRYNAAPIGILSLGERLTISECNLTFATMVGAQRHDLQGTPFSSLIVEEDRRMFFDNHQKCLQEQVQPSFNLRLRCPKGGTLVVRCDYIPPLPSKRQTDCHISLRDINIFKEMEDKLQKEIGFRQEILDALPCVAFLIRYETHEITASNRAALLGGAIPGRKCYRTWDNRNSACSWCRGAAVKYDGKAHHLQFWDRGTYWDNHWIPVTDDFYLHCIFDITEQERNKAELQISTDELERTVEKRSAELELSQQLLHSFEKLAAVGRVAVAIAQKFNDPLQAITNVLGGIHRRGSLEPEDMPLVNLAYDEVIKLNSLVKDLREFYQPTRGKTSLFDMQTELLKIIEANKPRLSDNCIRLTANWTENMPLIHAVPEQLRTVFESLLDSCIDGSPDTTAVHITTSVEKENIVVQVEDGSRSIDHTQILQLFDPFHREQSKSFTNNFGLVKSYAIITNHGGKMETIGDEENGSGFRVTLPIRRKAGHTDLTSA